jgi:hypothetical protein
MPKLPTAADFGGSPAARGNIEQLQAPQLRGLASAQSALVNAGQAVEEIGASMQAMDDKLTAARQAAQLSDALGKATGEIGELEIKYQNDADFKTSHKRFQDESGGIRAKYEKSVDDPTVRAAFNKQYGNIETTKRLNVMKMALGKEGEYNVASLDDSMTAYAKAAASAGNDAERELVINQARVSLAGMQQAGWITADNAAKREQNFVVKIDEARVSQAMFEAPGDTSTKLAFDPTFASNLDPDKRQDMIRQGWDRQHEMNNRERSEAKRLNEAQAEEIMKTASELDAAKKLTPGFVAKARNIVSHGEYQTLHNMMEQTRSGEAVKDNPKAFSDCMNALYGANPEEAKKMAFAYHKRGLIKNATLSTILGHTQTLTKEDGPKNEYHRSRSFVAGSFKVSENNYDMAANARLQLAVRDFDDFVNEKPRTDDEIRKKSNDIVKYYATSDMQAAAKRSGIGSRSDPKVIKEEILRKSQNLIRDRQANKVTQQQFNNQMREYKRALDAATKAEEHSGK